ncbi:hypothetical protein [Croceicoccus sp. BE223]|uniref:hypothetical protein n=1 Tax=Croceicoccus sp. BE223 TaxID=2817716 RepID=UPI00286244E3|nr:hypothetical protein [Croceicoccus sp. BE223]MDR7103649.1 multidrug transporter EmrE-like cation transporter [Croceicoccus sp. BE223]
MAEGNLTAGTIAIFAFLIVTQVLAVAFLPRTEAFTHPTWSVIFVITMGLSQYSFAWLLHKGAPISTLIPIMAALIPLALIFVGVFVYKEAASLLRVVVLVGACGLIGWASTMK